MNMNKISKIIDALSIHTDPESINILNEVGTNSSVDRVRELTSKALVKKNVHDSLSVVITNAGKGINDLSTVVAMNILEDTVNNHSEEEVRDNARSVKALMALSC